jgi:hypothetical protein
MDDVVIGVKRFRTAAVSQIIRRANCAMFLEESKGNMMVTKMQGTYLAEIWRTTLPWLPGRYDSGGLRMFVMWWLEFVGILRRLAH